MVAAGGGCYIPLHNDSMFGLAQCDNRDLHGQTLEEWTKPTETVTKRNAMWIDKLIRFMRRADDDE